MGGMNICKCSHAFEDHIDGECDYECACPFFELDLVKSSKITEGELACLVRNIDREFIDTKDEMIADIAAEKLAHELFGKRARSLSLETAKGK